MGYNQLVDFEWDPLKAEANERKHDVAFSLAVKAFRDPAKLETIDDAFDYGEERWFLLGRVGPVVFAIVYTLRAENIRIISARKADRSEQNQYWTRYLPS